MYERTTELDFDVIEKRIYDEDGKLVEIRKSYPPTMPVAGVKGVQFGSRWHVKE